MARIPQTMTSSSGLFFRKRCRNESDTATLMDGVEEFTTASNVLQWDHRGSQRGARPPLQRASSNNSFQWARQTVTQCLARPYYLNHGLDVLCLIACAAPPPPPPTMTRPIPAAVFLLSVPSQLLFPSYTCLLRSSATSPPPPTPSVLSSAKA